RLHGGRPRPVVYEDVNARKGKIQRAELVCGRWERGEVFHVGDSRQWVALEHQLTHTDPSKPIRKQRTDRFDAAVHAALALTGGATPDLGMGGSFDDEATWARIGATLSEGF
ncbi:MAG: hypothetical protein KC457_13645, partial [Myxococcales bacterium]|nr:hypothetical protein [Myxococcales bacterium]